MPNPRGNTWHDKYEWRMFTHSRKAGEAATKRRIGTQKRRRTGQRHMRDLADSISRFGLKSGWRHEDFTPEPLPARERLVWVLDDTMLIALREAGFVTGERK